MKRRARVAQLRSLRMGIVFWALLGLALGFAGGLLMGYRGRALAASVVAGTVGAMLIAFPVAAYGRVSILGFDPVSSLAAGAGALLFSGLVKMADLDGGDVA